MLMKLIFLDIICMCPHFSTLNREQRPWCPDGQYSGVLQPKGYVTPKQIFIGNQIFGPRAATWPYTLPEMDITAPLETHNVAHH